MPGSILLRKCRHSFPYAWYFVTFRTRNYQDFFVRGNAAQLVMDTLLNQSGQHTICLVVMPDHVHWMLRLKGKQTLSRVMQIAKTLSSQRLNRQMGHSGPIWQPGFQDRLIQNGLERYKLSHYLVQNPVRSGLVKNISEYPYLYAEWM